jgi:hypothetical protein
MLDVLIICPQCNNKSLIKLIGAGLSPIIKGTKTPCRGEREIKEKQPDYKPFWRNGKVDKTILKNPQKYIQEGAI